MNKTNSMAKKVVLGILSLVLLSQSWAVSSSEECAANKYYSPFSLSIVPDIIIGSASIAAATTGFIKNRNIDSWDGRAYDKDDINSFDKTWYNSYSHVLDNCGTVTCAINAAVLPLGIYGAQAIARNLPAKELATLGVMYAESYLLAYGIKNIIKCHIQRTRPYMYTDSKDEKSLKDGDYTLSFPSGHSTDAFMGAAFLSYTFCQYYPDSQYKIPVIMTSYAFAIGTGMLRIASGNHFITDVGSGALLGTAIGLAVPFIHNRISQVKYRGKDVLSFTGNSLTASFSF